MTATARSYIVAIAALSFGLAAFIYELATLPRRVAYRSRKEADLAELARLAEKHAALQEAIRAFEQLPYRAPLPLTQLLQSFADLNGTVRAEPEQPINTSWSAIPWVLVRGTVTFDNARFDRVWDFIVHAGSAQNRPPWRLAEIHWSPSAPGRGRVIVTLEALRAGDASPAAQSNIAAHAARTVAP